MMPRSVSDAKGLLLQDALYQSARRGMQAHPRRTPIGPIATRYGRTSMV